MDRIILSGPFHVIALSLLALAPSAALRAAAHTAESAVFALDLRSITPASAVAGKRIVTIEGLSPDGNHPLQRAWIAEQVPQCGYCHSGLLMTAAELLAKTPKPTDADIDAAIGGHICRCGTYLRVRRAIHRAAGTGAAAGEGGAR